MKRVDIDKVFSLLVKEYFDKGYVINTDTMNGNQGEVAKVDLMKDGIFIRVSLTKGFDFGKCIGSCDTLALVVGKRTEPIGKWETVWTDRLEDVERHVFWQIGEDWWIGIEEFAKKCFGKKKARWNNAYSNIDQLNLGMVFLPDSARKIVLNRVRTLPRCKSVKLSDIGKVWRERRDGMMVYCATVRDETRRIGEVKIA